MAVGGWVVAPSIYVCKEECRTCYFALFRESPCWVVVSRYDSYDMGKSGKCPKCGTQLHIDSAGRPTVAWGNKG